MTEHGHFRPWGWTHRVFWASYAILVACLAVMAWRAW